MAYLDANGVHTYYEEHGTGDPLLLLHGGGDSGEGWGAQVPVLSERYRVIVPDRRGHGRTPDPGAPLTYELMRDDTLAFLDGLGVERAHLVGWSDGGIVALLAAIARPSVADRIVTLGVNASTDGYTPEARVALGADSPFVDFMRQDYEALSADGADQWPTFLAKLQDLWWTPYDFLDQLAEIEAPTMLMAGDDDAIRPEHTLAMFRALPNGRMCIVPGASHLGPVEKPDLVNAIILDFLAGPERPEELMPLLRQ